MGHHLVFKFESKQTWVLDVSLTSRILIYSHTNTHTFTVTVLPFFPLIGLRFPESGLWLCVSKCTSKFSINSSWMTRHPWQHLLPLTPSLFFVCLYGRNVSNIRTPYTFCYLLYLGQGMYKNVLRVSTHIPTISRRPSRLRNFSPKNPNSGARRWRIDTLISFYKIEETRSQRSPYLTLIIRDSWSNNTTYLLYYIHFGFHYLVMIIPSIITTTTPRLPVELKNTKYLGTSLRSWDSVYTTSDEGPFGDSSLFIESLPTRYTWYVLHSPGLSVLIPWSQYRGVTTDPKTKTDRRTE